MDTEGAKGNESRWMRFTLDTVGIHALKEPYGTGNEKYGQDTMPPFGF